MWCLWGGSWGHALIRIVISLFTKKRSCADRGRLFRGPKNWCLRSVVLEKTLESPFDSKTKLVNLKGNQPWIFIGRTHAEAEALKFWSPDVKSWLMGKDPDAGKDWRLEEKGTTEDEMVGWHHQLNGHGFGWTPGVGDRQGGLTYCSSWGRKELDTTEQLNWTELKSQDFSKTIILNLLFQENLSH